MKTLTITFNDDSSFELNSELTDVELLGVIEIIKMRVMISRMEKETIIIKQSRKRTVK